MIILNTTLPRSQATYLWIIEGYSQQSWQPAKGPRLLPFRSPVEITIEEARENAYLHAGKTQGRKQEVGGKDRQPGQEDTNKPAATFVDFIDMFRWQGSFPLHFLFSAVAGSQISSIACPFYSCPTALPCPPFSWPVRGLKMRHKIDKISWL